MVPSAAHYLDQFTVVGINYRMAAMGLRAQFTLEPEAVKQLYALLRKQGCHSGWLLQTCNRVELYFLHQDAPAIEACLKTVSSGDPKVWHAHRYCYFGRGALLHLFGVAAGLDAQILGDQDIRGQVNKALQAAREAGMLGSWMEQIGMAALRCARLVRGQTGISQGTASVSFAAVSWLRSMPNLHMKRVLVLGLGKFGCRVAKNMLHYFPDTQVFVANRTNEKAEDFACAAGACFLPFASVAKVADSMDVVLVHTTAPDYLIAAEHFPTVKPRWILDLSVPANVHPGVALLPQTILADTDTISRVLDATMQARAQHVPAAMMLVEQHIGLLYQSMQQRMQARQIAQLAGQWHRTSGNPNTADTLQRFLRQGMPPGCALVQFMGMPSPVPAAY